MKSTVSFNMYFLTVLYFFECRSVPVNSVLIIFVCNRPLLSAWPQTTMTLLLVASYNKLEGACGLLFHPRPEAVIFEICSSGIRTTWPVHLSITWHCMYADHKTRDFHDTQTHLPIFTVGFNDIGAAFGLCSSVDPGKPNLVETLDVFFHNIQYKNVAQDKHN